MGRSLKPRYIEKIVDTSENILKNYSKGLFADELIKELRREGITQAKLNALRLSKLFRIHSLKIDYEKKWIPEEKRTKTFYSIRDDLE